VRTLTMAGRDGARLTVCGTELLHSNSSSPGLIGRPSTPWLLG
jgi:hypothetical protein